METDCYCGSSQPYHRCCEVIHHYHERAIVPEQLMRSRYSAHVCNLVDFVIQTYHPSCHAERQRETIQESIELNWCELLIIDSALNPQNSNEGFVHFCAYFMENGSRHCLEERSRFVKENGHWFYIDGEFPSPSLDATVIASKKQKRNAPCQCASGKKFKQCCGK